MTSKSIDLSGISIFQGEDVAPLKIVARHGIIFASSVLNQAIGYSTSIKKADDAFEKALTELKTKAFELNANAVISVQMQTSTHGSDNSFVLVTLLGTAATIK